MMQVKKKLEVFEPKIIAFVCNWCTYIAADAAGVARARYAPNVKLLRTMCSGRIDPQFVLAAFGQGADGILMCGCHPGDCHYREGNYKALRRFLLLQRLLPQLGVNPDRLRLEWISASEPEKFRRVADEITEHIRDLGPLREDGGK